MSLRSGAACLLLMTLACSSAWAGPKPVRSKTPVAPKKIYCWDEGGKRVCGDALPASAAAAARSEITKGVTTQVAAAPTEEERLAAQAAAQAQLQTNAEALERQQRLNAMIASYPDEASLTKYFDEQAQGFQDSIGRLDTAIAKSQQKMLDLLAELSDEELSKTPIPKTQSAQVVDLRNNILKQRASREKTKQDLAALLVDKESTIAAYRAAKAPPTDQAAAVPTTP